MAFMKFLFPSRQRQGNVDSGRVPRRKPTISTARGVSQRGPVDHTANKFGAQPHIAEFQVSKSSTSSSASSSSSSPYHDALLVTSSGRYEVMRVATPQHLAPTEIKIRTRAIGLNPIDYKSVAMSMCMPETPWINGREMSGIIEEVGSDVANFQPGDHVWTSTYYKKREAGCFQSCVVVPAHTVVPMPEEGLSFEAAACLGVPGLTAAMTLWHWLGVPTPDDESARKGPDGKMKQILIWGGSTITGQFATQLAVLAGLEVISVTSKKTSSIALSLGARHVIVRDDKNNDQIAQEIRALAHSLTLAIDLVSPDTARHALEVLSGQEPAILAPLCFLPRGSTIPTNVTVANVEMKKFVLDETTSKYAHALSRLVTAGRIKLPSFEAVGYKLDDIPEGLARLEKGDMRGQKLVVSLCD